MSTPADPARAIPVFTLPLAVLVLLVVTFGVVRGISMLWGTEVVVVVKPTPAGHYLEAGGLRVEEIDGYGVDDDAVVKKVEDAVGHVTLDALAGATPLSKKDITHSATLKNVRSKLQLRFGTEQVTVGDVKTGERVHLLFAPIAGAGAPRPQATEAVLLGHPEDGDDGMVWVALSAADRDPLLGQAARSRLIIAPAS